MSRSIRGIVVMVLAYYLAVIAGAVVTPYHAHHGDRHRTAWNGTSLFEPEL